MDIKNFGVQVKKIRNGKGITQDELSDIAEISISQLGRIERGEINTGLSTVFSIAKALNVSPHQLFHNGEADSLENQGVQLLMDAVTSMAASDFQFITPLIETDAPLKTLAQIIKKLSDEVKENTVSKNILNDVLETGNMGYWEYLPGNKTVFWCDNKFKLFGLTKNGNNISLDDVIATVKKDDQEVFMGHVSRIINTKGKIDFSYTGIHANGQELDVVVTAKLVEGKGNQTSKIIGISTVLNDSTHICEVLKNDLNNLKNMRTQMNLIVQSIQQDIQLPMQSIHNVLALLEKEVDLAKDDSITKKLNYIKDSCNDVSGYLYNLHGLTK